jgi:hypothetical protein
MSSHSQLLLIAIVCALGHVAALLATKLLATTSGSHVVFVTCSQGFFGSFICCAANRIWWLERNFSSDGICTMDNYGYTASVILVYLYNLPNVCKLPCSGSLLRRLLSQHRRPSIVGGIVVQRLQYPGQLCTQVPPLRQHSARLHRRRTPFSRVCSAL